MTATAMNDFLQQLHDLVPTFNVASIPKDAIGAYASPVHIIAELLNKKLETIKKINEISANVNLNCTRMKVIVNGTEQRNTIMVGNAVSIMRVLASCTRPNIVAIVAKLPAIAPAIQALVLLGTHNRPPPLVAPFVAMDVDGASANDLQDNDDMIIEDQFDFIPAQMMEFELKLTDGSDFVVPVRRDGYVNVTKICQAAGKRLDFYFKTDHAKESMDFLQKTLDDEHAENIKLGKVIPPYGGITLLTSYKGNSTGNEQGTFAHPDLAIIIAAWASKSFQFQVSRWIRELMIIGRVELGKEKSGPELKQKLEKTFQAVDEDTKAFLREKNCLELSLLRIECSKRQREDAAAEEERVAKRQREDYDNAKRQRDDAAADDKAKEESRMQLVRFDAEMAAKAIAIEEEKEAKRQRDDAAFEEEMRVKKIKIICVILRFLNVTGACIYFKNKNDSNSNERFSTTITRLSSYF